MKLDDKVAIVTGGGSGIGEAIAMRFAHEHAKVAIADIDHERAKRTEGKIADLGGDALAVPTNVTQVAEVDRMIDAVLGRFAKVDILINSAGIRPISSILEMPDEHWHQTIATNLTGTFFCLRAAARAMVGQGTGGAIINLASIAGLRGVRNRAHYGASKAAIVNLTQVAALELSPHRIRINAIAPGFVETPMTAHYLTATDPDTKLIVEKSIANIPLGRWGQPSDIAAAALYLASDDASYVTGTTLVVDAGVTAGT
ncbi:MAG TPA: SDR family NAD(P)-dependent oxidoreductase [Candidatus Binataceae bacterium]|nr:SDR family NAD(P)-dependent oxidoreductase [Candidatus Binataceae bacterium]